MIEGLYKIFDHWHCRGTVWIYSDPHFGDKEHECLVPNRVSDEEQIKRINSKVGKNDALIILGDIGDIECVRRLRGYKILIAGNHDMGLSNYKRDKEYYTFDKAGFTKDEAVNHVKLAHPGWQCKAVGNEDYWCVIADNRLFDEVYGGPLMISEKLILSHEPVDVPWAFNIHGHAHGASVNDDHHLNLCAEKLDYTPVNLNRLFKNGLCANVTSIHRDTIDKATARKHKRGGKKFGRKAN